MGSQELELRDEFERQLRLDDAGTHHPQLSKQKSQRLTVPIHQQQQQQQQQQQHLHYQPDYTAPATLQRRDTAYSDDSSNPSFPGSPYPATTHPYASLSPPPPFHYAAPAPVSVSNAPPASALPQSHFPPTSRLSDPFSHANGYRVADWTRQPFPPSNATAAGYQPAPAPKMPPAPPRTMMHGQDEVISNAIVIKNIPFAVPKETLLAVMEDLRLPLPFAFNYHFDNGQFRGLAFANFRQDSDAALTVTALNGFDLQGRKLRTEFKRVLKEGEKEKIEREKAIKRMRSQQQMYQPHPQDAWGRPPPLPTQSHYHDAQVEEHDYGALLKDGSFSTGPTAASNGGRPFVNTDVHSSSTNSTNAHSNSHTYSPFSVGPSYSTSPPSDVGTSISTRMTTQSSASSDYSKSELDLNDPQALEIYSRVLLFKDDSLRDELAFSRSLTPTQRRTVHLVAQKLNLSHKSVGENEERHVVVFKAVPPVSLGLPEASKPLRHAQSTLGRHTSRDVVSWNLFPDETTPSGNAAAGTATSSTTRSTSPSGSDLYNGHGPARLTNSPLRTKKSMPDIRPSSNSSSSSLTAPISANSASSGIDNAWNSSNFYHSGSSNLQSRRSGGNLREHYHSSSPTKRSGSGYPSMKGLFAGQPTSSTSSGSGPAEGGSADSMIPPVPKVPLSLQAHVSAPIGTPAAASPTSATPSHSSAH